MNIELDEVVLQDVSDDALEMAAGGAQEGAAMAQSVAQSASNWYTCCY